MYLDYFGLEREPFTISPDPSFLYPSLPHRKALAHLKYGLEREGGFILLTGEVGTGKTTLTRLLLQQLPGNIRVAYILNARLGEEDLLLSICQELSIRVDPNKASLREYTDLLNKDLLQAHAAGKKTLVVIEEAQNLDPEVLEMLRLLTNLETNTTKLLHILLVGQPELLELIARPELRQLNQRVVSRFDLQPLNVSETSNYIRHRMRRAGCKRPVFERSSIIEIHSKSNGVPRLINLICERCLLGAYAANDSGVARSVVANAAKEVLGETMPDRRSLLGGSWIKGLACAALLLGLVFSGWYFSNGYFVDSEPQAFADMSQEQTMGGNADVVTSSIEQQRSAESGSDDELVSRLARSASEVRQSLPSAYAQLLSLWSIDAQVTRQTDMCDVAAREELVCSIDSNLNERLLKQVRRPGIVRLVGENDQFSTYLITSMLDEEVVLSNASGQRRMAVQDFAEVWEGSFLYLWAPPPGFEETLRVGQKNSSVVGWLQNRLVEWNPLYEEIITGGIYSSALSDEVKRFQSEFGIAADGVLGMSTIMSLNDLNSKAPHFGSTEAGSEQGQ